jgi:hypothetical protein
MLHLNSQKLPGMFGCSQAVVQFGQEARPAPVKFEGSQEAWAETVIY